MSSREDALRDPKGESNMKNRRGADEAVLGLDCDVAQRSLRMYSMVADDLPHPGVDLEEDGEELTVLDGNLEAFEGVACTIHAREEVEDDMFDG